MRDPITPVRALALVLLACTAAPAQEDAQAPDFEAVRAQVESVVREAKIPGTAVAVTVGDRIAWHDTFGDADLAAHQGVTIHTRFRVGSVTKLLTATALMRLVEQERVRLDDPVSKYLPDFPHGEITLRQLAGHVGGIRNYSRSEYVNGTHYADAVASLARFASDPLVAPPGTKYAYSTYGYVVLGAVIERVTGERFDAALRALVLDAADMEDTSLAEDAATTKFYVANDAEVTAAPPIDLTDRLPAGAALATARDLARFLIATGSASFLSDAARTTMFTPQKLADGNATNVGIGWRVAQDEKGRTFVHHGGDAMGGRAFVLLYPSERVGVVFVSNLSFAPFDEKNAAAIAASFLD